MRYLSAQYVITSSGPPVKRGIICADADGTIISIEDNDGRLEERHSVEFYNGIIVPGFINCHCHLEYSFLKGELEPGTGLGRFLAGVTAGRNKSTTDSRESIKRADREMADQGIVLCADICNTSSTFDTKIESRIKYINLLEVYGIDSLKASKRISELLTVAGAAEDNGLEWYIVPHSVYSVSAPLFRNIRELSGNNKVTSIHFLESESEISMIENRSGKLMEAYIRILDPSSVTDMVKDHVVAVLDEITHAGNLILVHNTVIKKDHIRKLRERSNIFYCICPQSNLYIEKMLPPLPLLTDENCKIVIGTDSLSSNKELSMLSEMKTLQDNFPEYTLETLIRWATINGAEALGKADWAGSIEPGKKPGLVLIRDADLTRMKLLPGSSSSRLL